MKEKEIRAVADFLRHESQAMYDESILEYRPKGVASGDEVAIDDELFEEAKQISVASGKASASLLQRRLRIGYARAARLLDMLEQEGIIGPADGAKPREVLISAVQDASSEEF
jgi:S-DNA-T family DNA segregation ATPase FtsK/SpoIIIE